MDFKELVGGGGGGGGGPEWDGMVLNQVQTAKCHHDKIRMYCPCEKSFKPVIVCVKCHMVFCDENCSETCNNKTNKVVEDDDKKAGGGGGGGGGGGAKSNQKSVTRPRKINDVGASEAFGDVEMNISSKVQIEKKDKEEVKGAAAAGGSAASQVPVNPVNNNTDTSQKNPALKFVPTSVIRAGSKSNSKSGTKKPQQPPLKVVAGTDGVDSNKVAASASGASATAETSKTIQPKQCPKSSVDLLDQIKSKLEGLSVAKTKEEEEAKCKTIKVAEITDDFLKLSPKPLDPKDKKAYYMLTEIDKSGKVNIVQYSDNQYLSMTDCCMDSDDFDFLTSTPKVGSYVMAVYDETGQFYRALVEKVYGDYATLYYLDLGAYKFVKYNEIKPPVKEAYTYPVMGYQGWLHGVEENLQLIHPEEFAKFKSRVIRRYYVLKEVVLNDQRTEFVLSDKRSELCLSQELNKLKVWAWERQLRNFGSGEDVDLIEKGRWKDTSLDSVELLVFPKGTEVDATFLDDLPSDSKTCFMVPKLTGRFLEARTVLEAQMTRYCKLVKATQYYPTLNDAFLYFDGTCYHRCRRMSEDIILSLDTGIKFPLPEADDPDKRVRRMPPEFLRVPIGLIECEIQGSITATKNPSRETIFKIKIVRFNENDLKHVVKVLNNN